MSDYRVEQILRKPYSRLFVFDDESGSFSASIVEFPGCVAEGVTIEEAARNLDRAAESWLQAVLDLGQKVPAPIEREFSGRYALRFPYYLHKRCALRAKLLGVSLNQYIIQALLKYSVQEEG